MAKVWTKVKESILAENYGLIPDVELATKLGVTLRALKIKAKALDLKPKEPLVDKNTMAKRDTSKVAILGGEKVMKVEGEKVEFIPSGLKIKTEKGWEPVMIHKSRVTR